MKATLDRKRLVTALKHVQPAASRSSSLAVLSGVRIDATSSGVELCCTDIATTCTAIVTEPKRVTKGSVVTPVAVLARVVEKMAGETVTFTTEDEKLTVTSGETVATLPLWKASDWPLLPEVEGDPVEWSAEDVALVRTILPMASTDHQVKPELCTLYLNRDEAVCLDGYRMGVVTELPAIDSALVPSGAVRALLVDGEGAIVQVGERVVAFSSGTRKTVVRVVEGKFPTEYWSLVPKDAAEPLVFSREAMVDAVDRAASIGLETTVPSVVLDRDGDKIMIIGQSPTGDTLVDVVPCSGPFEGPIKLNPSQFGDMLAALDEDVELIITDRLKPVVGKRHRLTTAMMPVRVGVKV